MVPEAAEIGVAARRIDHDEMTVGEIVEGVLQAPRLVGFGRCGLRRGGALDGAVLGLLERQAPVFALDLFALASAVAPEGGAGALTGVEVGGADPDSESLEPSVQEDTRGGICRARLPCYEH